MTSTATTSTSEVQAPLHRLQLAGAATVTALGLVVLVVGWFLDVDVVTRLHPDLVSMKANTAVGFILLGITVGTANGEGRAVSSITAVALVLLGSATILEYGFDLDLGIDQLLATDTNLVHTGTPGRMGLNTAIGFTLMGAGRIAGPFDTRWARIAERLAVATTAFIAFLAFTGYVYGTTSTRRLGSATEMALHTALAFLVACLAMIPPLSDRGVLRVLHSEYAGGQVVRRHVPAITGLLVAVTLSVELLEVVGLLDQQALVLAYLSTFSVAVVVASLFLTAVRLDRRDRDASRAAALAVDQSRQLEALLRVFPDRHYRLGPDGAVLSHHGDAAAVGWRLDDRYPKLDLDALRRAATAAAPSPGIVTFVDDDGDGWKTLEARAVGLPDDELALTVRDVTELASASAALAELNRELEQRVADRTRALDESNRDLARSNRELEQFAYVASHDLKEPLRMVNSFVRRIRDRYDDQLDDRGRQYIAFAVEGAERMEALIDSILRYSRVSRTDLDVAPVDGDVLLADVRRTLARVIQASGATVEIDPMPTIVCDGLLLGQVFVNLITNALKFVPDDRSPQVHVWCETVGDGIQIHIDDNGIGIPTEHREDVFAVFKRLNARDEFEGTGIGLAIAQRVVERHNGHIAIADSPLGGTRFTVALPAARPMETA